MIVIDLSVGSRYPVNRSFIRTQVTEYIQKKGIKDAEISVSVVGTRKMTDLHVQYMQLEGPTDVLSFPQYDPTQPDKVFPPLMASESAEGLVIDGESAVSAAPRHLGDIVVCFPEAVTQARKFGKLVDEQIVFLVEHGIEHLLGYHHD